MSQNDIHKIFNDWKIDKVRSGMYSDTVVRHIDVYKWMTADGREMHIDEMSETHIINAIGMLQRKINDMESVEFQCDAIDTQIQGWRDSIGVFVLVLNSRV